MGGWNTIYELITKSKRNIKLLEGEERKGREECKQLNVPEGTALYEIIINCEGIIIDNWLRILGQGGEKCFGVDHYNICADYIGNVEGLFIVANDSLGGLFAINISRFDNDRNYIWYFAPDSLEWESLGLKYHELVSWAITGDVDGFYSSMRWKEWEKYVEKITAKDAILIYPFLWAKECNLETASKKIVPIDEIINLNFEYSKKIHNA